MNKIAKSVFILIIFVNVQIAKAVFSDQGIPMINHYGIPYMGSLFAIEHNPLSVMNLMPDTLSNGIIKELNITSKSDLQQLISEKKINLHFYTIIWGRSEPWPPDRLYYILFHDIVKKWVSKEKKDINLDNFNLNIDMGLFNPNGVEYPLPIEKEDLIGPISFDKFAPKSVAIHPSEEAIKRTSIGPWFSHELLYSPANANLKLKDSRIVANFWTSIILPDKKNIFIIFNTLIDDDKLKDSIHALPYNLSSETLTNFIKSLKIIASTIETEKKEDIEALNKSADTIKKAITFSEPQLTTYKEKEKPYLHILGPDGYDELIRQYENLLKIVQENLMTGNIDNAKKNFNALKNIFDQIKNNALNDVINNTPLRAYLSEQNFYPKNKIYLSQEQKQNSVIYLQESIKEKVKTIEALWQIINEKQIF